MLKKMKREEKRRENETQLFEENYFGIIKTALNVNNRSTCSNQKLHLASFAIFFFFLNFSLEKIFF